MTAGCGKKDEKNEDPGTPTQAPTETPDDTADDEDTSNNDDAATEGAVKTGLAVLSSLSSSKDAGDSDGAGQADSTVIAVLVDENGTIVNCFIDAVQPKVTFSSEGKITSDVTAEVLSKQELGTEYGMIAKSDIGKEWNEQADAFAAYVIGKTVDEVKGIAVEEGKAADEDLKASVTIHITDFMAGVEKAAANAQDLGANAGDKLGVGIVTSLSDSKDASAEGDGLTKGYSYFAAVSTDADGKITSAVVDAYQGEVNFSTEGVITSDLTAEQQTKQELGDAYGMKGRSDIGKEWYEQANAFAAYVTGKTLDEVTGIAVEEGYAADADLKSSVTIHITDMKDVVAEAVNYAK